MIQNLTPQEQSVLEGIATTDLLDEICIRFQMSNANEFLTKTHIDILRQVVQDPTTGTL
jgi:hypothetical protein